VNLRPALFLILSLVACSATTGSHDMGGYPPYSSMSYDQAWAKVWALVNESLAAFPPGAKLAPIGPGDGSGEVWQGEISCTDSDSVPPDTPVTFQPDFWVRGIGTTGNDKYVDAFIRYWRGRGWLLTRDDPHGGRSALLTSKDGLFAVTIQLTVDGTGVSVGASSPCVKPKGP
jgi:hypothetical protein